MAFDLIAELEQLVDALHADAAEYALCGGLALAVHGHPRATKDIDLLVRAEAVLDAHLEAAAARAERGLARAERDVESLHAQVRAHDPAHALARGWTITTTADGRPVPRVEDLVAGASLVTRFADGTVTSTVSDVRPHPATAPPQEPAP